MNEIAMAIRALMEAINGSLPMLSTSIITFANNYKERTGAYDKRTKVLEKLAAQGKQVGLED